MPSPLEVIHNATTTKDRNYSSQYPPRSISGVKLSPIRMGLCDCMKACCVHRTKRSLISNYRMRNIELLSIQHRAIEEDIFM